MPSYVITGVSRGIGWAFLKHLSSDPSTKIIGIVRNKPATDMRVTEELGGRPNITILGADLTDYGALEKAAKETAAITEGRLDYLIANAANIPQWDLYEDIGTLGKDAPEELTKQFYDVMHTNVLAQIHLYSLFMPQILIGNAKKVIVISSGMGDIELVRDYDLITAPIYSISKAAVNMVTAKFSAQYKKDGVLFLSICPGFVDVGHLSNVPDDKKPTIETMLSTLQRYSPTFKGPSTAEKSVKDILSVVESSSIEKGHGGAYLSHFGTKQWM